MRNSYSMQNASLILIESAGYTRVCVEQNDLTFLLLKHTCIDVHIDSNSFPFRADAAKTINVHFNDVGFVVLESMQNIGIRCSDSRELWLRGTGCVSYAVGDVANVQSNLQLHIRHDDFRLHMYLWPSIALLLCQAASFLFLYKRARRRKK